jgi:hypothetical protein
VWKKLQPLQLLRQFWQPAGAGTVAFWRIIFLKWLYLLLVVKPAADGMSIFNRFQIRHLFRTDRQTLFDTVTAAGGEATAGV